MLLETRDYQDRMLGEARELMQQGIKKILFESATGSGKTVMVSKMVKTACERALPTWFLLHRQELIKQTAKTFQKYEIPFGIVGDGHERQPEKVVQIISIPSLINCLGDFKPPHMAGWDETHHIGSATWDRVYKHCPTSYHIGMSATPILPSGKTLGPWFDRIVHGPTIPELIRRGFLSDYVYFAPTVPDMSEVRLIGGDYNSADVDKIMRGKAIVGDIVAHWLREARGLKTMGFAPTVAASKEYVAAFIAAGVRAAHLDGKTHKDERARVLMEFALGNIDIVFNVGLFGEGFDLAAYTDMDITIECVILADPTKSITKHKQQVGRAMRPKSRPAVILDHAGNWLRHGMPDDIIEWSLDNKPVRRSASGGTSVPICQCEQCSRVFPPAQACPHCGFVRPVKDRPLIYFEDDLKEIKRAEAADIKRREEEKAAAMTREVNAARTLPQLQAIERERGYKSGWAILKFKSRRKR